MGTKFGWRQSKAKKKKRQQLPREVAPIDPGRARAWLGKTKQKNLAQRRGGIFCWLAAGVWYRLVQAARAHTSSCCSGEGCFDQAPRVKLPPGVIGGLCAPIDWLRFGLRFQALVVLLFLFLLQAPSSSCTAPRSNRTTVSSEAHYSWCLLHRLLIECCGECESDCARQGEGASLRRRVTGTTTTSNEDTEGSSSGRRIE